MEANLLQRDGGPSPDVRQALIENTHCFWYTLDLVHWFPGGLDKMIRTLLRFKIAPRSRRFFSHSNLGKPIVCEFSLWEVVFPEIRCPRVAAPVER